MKTRSAFFPLILLLLVSATNLLSAEDLVKQGDAYDAKFEPEKALEFYLPAEQANPADAALQVKIARQYIYKLDDAASKDDKLKLGRIAVGHAERAVKLAPEACDSHLAVAICLGKMTPFLGAQEQMQASRRIKDSAETAVKLAPENDYAWHMLGRWHQALAGMSGFTKSIAQLVYGSLPPASNEEAVKCFQKAIELRPSRLIHHVELGRTYAQMGKKEEAKKALQKGLAMPNKERDDPETKERGKYTLSQLM